jgi:tRNA nucleotidyltransferase (CCA-adding enzyme)
MKKIIYNILKKLEDNNFEAFIVGGFVRDNILNIATYDIDICTNARLEDLIKLFKYDQVFNEYSSIKIKYKKYNISINTYRKELEYKNNKPVKIKYVNSLEEDLIRRDFTINALCYDKDFILIDIYGYKKDLDNRIIKTIGDTHLRLIEDKTRILRAIRLSCLLDFKIDDEIIDYIKNNRDFLNFITINKYKEELDKIIINNKFNKLLEFINNNELCDVFKFNDVINVDVKEGIYSQIKLSSNFPFTKKEKKVIAIFKTIIKNNDLTDKDILDLGLKNSLVIGKIINKNLVEIRKRYNNLKKSL